MDCIYIAPLSKALYNSCLSFTHTHTHTHIHTPTAIGCHVRYQPARQEQLGVRCLAQGHFDTPRVRIEPATLRLPDDSSYLLSHIAPKVQGKLKGPTAVRILWWIEAQSCTLPTRLQAPMRLGPEKKEGPALTVHPIHFISTLTHQSETAVALMSLLPLATGGMMIGTGWGGDCTFFCVFRVGSGCVWRGGGTRLLIWT